MTPFPFFGLQGGPHNHQIGALAVALKHVATDEFKQYAKQVCRSQALMMCTGVNKYVQTKGTNVCLVAQKLG